jgi:hypothetical protein
MCVAAYFTLHKYTISLLISITFILLRNISDITNIVLIKVCRFLYMCSFHVSLSAYVWSQLCGIQMKLLGTKYLSQYSV